MDPGGPPKEAIIIAPRQLDIHSEEIFYSRICGLTGAAADEVLHLGRKKEEVVDSLAGD